MSPIIMLSGGPPGALPDSIAGLQLWYDAAEGVYEDAAATDAAEDTDVVLAWVDRENSFKVEVAVNGPTYDIDGVNGRPFLAFDATNDVLSNLGNTTDDYLGTSNTEFVVVKYAASPSADVQQLIGITDGGWVIEVKNQAAAANMQATNDDGGIDTASKASTMTDWNVVSRMNNGTNLYVGVTDTRTASMASVASGNTVFGANTNLYIRNVPATNNAVDIAEVIHYNVALSEADRKLVETRLAWKYGLTLPY